MATQNVKQTVERSHGECAVSVILFLNFFPVKFVELLEVIAMETTMDVAASKPEEISKEMPPPKEKPSYEKPVKEVAPKRSKKEERQNKKDDRAVEQFLKSLDSMSPSDKYAALSKKFSEVTDENRRVQAYINQSNKRLTGALKEKEQLQLEYNRTVLVKSKLENLCRELQKQNKSIKEESLLKIREEEERRKETQGKFQTALSEITTLLQQNNEKNSKLRDDNVSMSAKFKSVVEKYELREQQVEKMAKQMSLEQQLAEARLAKAGLEAQAERERLVTEIAQLKLQLGQCHARIVENQNTESSLRGQLNVYTDKYDEFQNALVKSNQVFGGFKGEIDKMSKKITKLEKECMSWKKRWESSQAALLEMATERRLWDERAAAADRQLAQLQRLCRGMQAERNLLLNTLKEHNIERPPMPVLPPAPPAPAPQPASSTKVDAMAANCAQLKQSLAQLQNQLNVLTTKKEEENQAKAEQQPQTGKSKKGKGKKNKSEKEKIVQQESAQESTEETDKEKFVQQESAQESTEETDKEKVVEQESAQESTKETDKETVVQQESAQDCTEKTDKEKMVQQVSAQEIVKEENIVPETSTSSESIETPTNAEKEKIVTPEVLPQQTIPSSTEDKVEIDVIKNLSPELKDVNKIESTLDGTEATEELLTNDKEITNQVVTNGEIPAKVVMPNKVEECQSDSVVDLTENIDCKKETPYKVDTGKSNETIKSDDVQDTSSEETQVKS